MNENLHQHVTSDYLERANSPSQVESFISFGQETLESLNLRLFASDSSEVMWWSSHLTMFLFFCQSEKNTSVLIITNDCLPSILGRHCRDRHNTVTKRTIQDAWWRFPPRNDTITCSRTTINTYDQFQHGSFSLSVYIHQPYLDILVNTVTRISTIPFICSEGRERKYDTRF